MIIQSGPGPLNAARVFRISRTFLPAILPACVGLALSLLLINPFLSDSGDNAYYMILAKSMATGQGFSNISEPGSPAFKLYPYAYPALLSLQMHVVGADRPLADMIVPLKVSSALFFAGSLILLFYLVSRWHSIHAAFVTAMLFAVSPLALRYSSDVMSETPFLFFSLATLAITLKAIERPVSLGKDLTAGAALALTFYVRTVGITLIAATLIYVLVKCGFRRALTLGLVLLVLLIPWLYQEMAYDTSPTYMDQFLGARLQEAQPYPDETLPSETSALERWKDNLTGYISYQVPKAIFPHLADAARADSANYARLVKLAILLFMGIGWFGTMRGRPLLPDVYLAVSLTILSVWWEIDRLLLPLVPFLVFFLVAGLTRIAGAIAFIPRRGAVLLGPALLVPVAVSALIQDCSAIRSNIAHIGANSASSFYAGTSPEYANYFRAAEWLKENSPPGSVIMSSKPSLTHVYSDRLSISSAKGLTPEGILYLIETEGVDYVIQDDIPWVRPASKDIGPAVEARQEEFVLEYVTPEPVTRVWRYSGPLR